MAYNIRMFDSWINVVVVEDTAYSSVVTHSHEFVEIVLIKEGKAVSIIDDKHIPVSSGDMFVIADVSINHSIQPNEGEELKVLNIIFPFSFYDVNYSQFHPHTIYKASDSDDIIPIIKMIKKEYKTKNLFFDNITFSLTAALLNILLRLTPKLIKVNRAAMFKQQRFTDYIDTAVTYIKENYDKPITVDDVARTCNVCRAYIQRLFKKERDTSIKEYIIKYRIEQSCKLLLHTDFSISTIAEMVGFGDLKYFYLKFKQIVGETPKNFKLTKEGKHNAQ